MARSAHPSAIGASARWRDTLRCFKQQVSDDQLSIVAAGVAFYFLLAVFAALTATVSLYGPVLDPQQVSEQIDRLRGLLPTRTSRS